MRILSIPNTRNRRIYSIAFSPDGNSLAAYSADGHLRIWESYSGEIQVDSAFQDQSFEGRIAYLDGKQLVVPATNDLRIWDVDRNGWRIVAPDRLFFCRIALSFDRRLFVAAAPQIYHDGGSSGVTILDTSTWDRLPDFEQSSCTTGGISFSNDGLLIATGHIRLVNRSQRLIEIATLSGDRTIQQIENEYDYVVHVRDAHTGKISLSLEGWKQPISNLAFSPDDTILVGTAGPRLRVWDVRGNCEIALHKRGMKHFQGIAFTPDGRYLASVSNDETVRIWETKNWQEHTTFTWKIGKLLNIALSPDGLRAAAGGDKGQIVIWDLEE